MTPDELKARVLHRDADILILDKPAGLAVHKGFGRGPTVDDFLDALCFEAAARPALAHRLDRETSGCLVLGRHREALRRLGRLFAQGRVEKIYWAVVEGAPPVEEGRIDVPLKKRSPDYGWWMAPDPEGQPRRHRLSASRPVRRAQRSRASLRAPARKSASPCSFMRGP